MSPGSKLSLTASVPEKKKRDLGFHLGMFQTVFLFYWGIKPILQNSNLKTFDARGKKT